MANMNRILVLTITILLCINSYAQQDSIKSSNVKIKVDFNNDSIRIDKMIVIVNYDTLSDTMEFIGEREGVFYFEYGKKIIDSLIYRINIESYPYKPDTLIYITDIEAFGAEINNGDTLYQTLRAIADIKMKDKYTTKRFYYPVKRPTIFIANSHSAVRWRKVIMLYAK